MSTKAIREALEALATFDGVDGDPMTVFSELALREVEAIERAAKAVHKCGVHYPVARSGISDSEWNGACNIMASIAKDAP